MPSRKELANAIRALSMDAVQQANSGHPGMPMGMADIAEVLWNDFLKHNPNNPHWINRDRFILSNGHGSMLLYSLLHLTGYDLTIDDIKHFRQLHSRTPGHPEYGQTPGVETTTGPLGQGIANAVGMAIAQTMLAAHFNRENHAIINHHTYTFMGDGCMMEGLSHEACSLAGTLKLGKLIAFWDDNSISIDGDVAGWFTDNTPERFKAYGWHVVANVDGHDPDAIKAAIEKAQKVTDQPSLICCKTIIGFGAPNAAGSHESHGAPLGQAEITAARENLAWQYPPFEIPATIYQAWDKKEQGQQLEEEWEQQFERYQEAYPLLAAELLRRLSGDLPANWSDVATQFIQQCQQTPDAMATRKASLNSLNAYAPHLPEVVGGSADLSGSNLTNWRGCSVYNAENRDGNYLHYGVREFGMSAIVNGMALYGGFIPFAGTFLTFSDYARNAVRLAALMEAHSIFVYTHDSIGLGEDGPTHQPIEHLGMLRLTPGLHVYRPCDSVETAVAWQLAIENKQPCCLVFSRQSLPHQQRDALAVNNIVRGGYVLVECKDTPDMILIATGSEVNLAVETAKELTEQGGNVRVVSMPCTELFDEQDAAYKESVLPSKVKRRVAIEASSKDYWYKYVGLEGLVIGMDQFGYSAPDKQLFDYFGFTVKKILEKIHSF